MSLFDSELYDLNDECIAEFADSIEYFHTGPDVAFTLCGVFFSALTREETADAASFHRVFCRSADFAIKAKRGDLVRTGGQEYVVIDLHEDHGGGLMLTLNLDSF